MKLTEIDYTTLPIGVIRKIKGQNRLVVDCPKCHKPGLFSPPFMMGEKAVQFVTHKEVTTGLTTQMDSCRIDISAGEPEIRVARDGTYVVAHASTH